MSNIKIVALVTVKPEYTETLKPLFQSLVKASRAEEGNVSYDLHQEIGKPNRFVSSKLEIISCHRCAQCQRTFSRFR